MRVAPIEGIISLGAILVVGREVQGIEEGPAVLGSHIVVSQGRVKRNVVQKVAVGDKVAGIDFPRGSRFVNRVAGDNRQHRIGSEHLGGDVRLGSSGAKVGEDIKPKGGGAICRLGEKAVSITDHSSLQEKAIQVVGARQKPSERNDVLRGRRGLAGLIAEALVRAELDRTPSWLAREPRDDHRLFHGLRDLRAADNLVRCLASSAATASSARVAAGRRENEENQGDGSSRQRREAQESHPT